MPRSLARTWPPHPGQSFDRGAEHAGRRAHTRPRIILQHRSQGDGSAFGDSRGAFLRPAVGRGEGCNMWRAKYGLAGAASRTTAASGVPGDSGIATWQDTCGTPNLCDRKHRGGRPTVKCSRIRAAAQDVRHAHEGRSPAITAPPTWCSPSPARRVDGRAVAGRADGVENKGHVPIEGDQCGRLRSPAKRSTSFRHAFAREVAGRARRPINAPPLKMILSRQMMARP